MKVKFTGVYIIGLPNGEFGILPSQGLHTTQVIGPIQGEGGEPHLADLIYDTETFKYSIESLETCLKPDSSTFHTNGARLATQLRELGFYRAEYGGTGLTFSQITKQP